ncbi:ribosomal RNA large subunit methyltransferase H [Planctomycetota bacterium]|nr:ribosomal RNA large subunit methyltransferase H [Planctomycetota bacterium]
MRCILLQTGHLRDREIIALRDEYVKRFSRFGTLTVVEAAAKGDAPVWPKAARWRVALDERGEQYSSTELAARLAEWTMRHGAVAFCVGDADGHHGPTLASADARWSLGRLTLPHALAHLVVAEQLYRAATIRAGTGYHHA